MHERRKPMFSYPTRCQTRTRPASNILPKASNTRHRRDPVFNIVDCNCPMRCAPSGLPVRPVVCQSTDRLDLIRFPIPRSLRFCHAARMMQSAESAVHATETMVSSLVRIFRNTISEEEYRVQKSSLVSLSRRL